MGQSSNEEMTPEQVRQHAESLAFNLLQLSEENRFLELGMLQAENPLLYVEVRQALQSLRKFAKHPR